MSGKQQAPQWQHLLHHFHTFIEIPIPELKAVGCIGLDGERVKLGNPWQELANVRDSGHIIETRTYTNSAGDEESKYVYIGPAADFSAREQAQYMEAGSLYPKRHNKNKKRRGAVCPTCKQPRNKKGNSR